MKKISQIGAIAISCLMLLALSFTSCTTTTPEWTTDFDAALEEAKASNKNILVFFSGLGWDGASQPALDDILNAEDFKKKAGKEFILVNIDIPQDESLVDPTQLEYNYTLVDKYYVEAVPTIIAITTSDVVFGELLIELNVTTKKDAMKELDEIIKAGKQIETLTKKIEKAEGPAKAKLIDELVETLPEAYVGKIAELITMVPELDPNNETGLLGKYKLQQAYIDVVPYLSTGDYSGAGQFFVDLINEGILDAEQQQMAYYMAAYLRSGGGISIDDTVVDYLQKAYDANPDGDNAASIKQTLDAIKATTTEGE